MIPSRIQCYNIHLELILLDLFTISDIYDNDSYASYTDWKIEKTPGIDSKKLEFNINKPETDLKKKNDREAVHPNCGLADDNNNNIEDHGAQRNTNILTNTIVLYSC